MKKAFYLVLVDPPLEKEDKGASKQKRNEGDYIDDKRQLFVGGAAVVAIHDSKEDAKKEDQCQANQEAFLVEFHSETTLLGSSGLSTINFFSQPMVFRGRDFSFRKSFLEDVVSSIRGRGRVVHIPVALQDPPKDEQKNRKDEQLEKPAPSKKSIS